MTTARSSFSLSRLLPVYRNMLRRYRGSALFYGALGFICLPVQYLLTILQNNGHYPDYGWLRWSFAGPALVYNGFSAFFFTALMLVVPLIMAVNLFSYLHNRRSVDVYHSLPLTRCELYAACSLAGITLIWVPLALNFLLTAAISLLLPAASAGMILLELLCWMVITFVIFSITAFCAVQLGTDFDTVIFSLGLNGVFAAVYLLFLMLGDAFIYGFAMSGDAVRLSYRLSPVSLMIGRMAISYESYEYIVENNLSMLVWLLIGFVVLAAGAWRYTRRKSEQAEAVGEMGPLQIFLRSVGTLLGGTGLGLILCAVFEIDPENSRFLCLFCIGVGSMLVYFIGDVILSRSVRSIPKALPVAVLTSAGVCVLVGGMMFDILGLGKWQPEASQVSAARLTYYNSRFSDQPSLGRDNTVIAFEDPDAVALVLAAQKEQIDLYRSGQRLDTTYGSGSLRLNYSLKNGRDVGRRYYGIYPSVLEDLLALEADDELIRQTHPAFAATPEQVYQVTVTNTLGSNAAALALDASQKERLLAALREDLLAQPLEEIKNGAKAVCTLSIEFKYSNEYSGGLIYDYGMDSEKFSVATNDWDDTYSYAVSDTMLTESYRNTLSLLRELGASRALENNWSDVKTAYALPFNRDYGATGIIARTDLGRVIQTRADIDDFLEDFEREAAGLTPQSFMLSPMELNAAKGSLSSTALTYGEPFAVLGVAAGEDPEEMTGYYLVPISALPEHLKQAVTRMVECYYGTYALESWGYGTTAAAWSQGVAAQTAEQTVVVGP